MHDQFMREAITLSRQGFPAPNPHVGCVIVNQDKIVGRGFCNHDGADHAEVMALKEAKENARGGIAYVTLEPCNHFGKTPPCSQALINAGIKKVVIACADPNPVAAGGAEFLRKNGVEVTIGQLAHEAAQANIQFLFSMTHRRPMVTVKAGITLDGKVALADGSSKWITNEHSRQDVMRLRAEIGCVMVGRVTAEVDQARLNVRGIEVVNQPLRVVIDPSDRLSSELPIFDRSAPTLRLNNQSGITTPVEILAHITAKKQTGVLIEGGPSTSAHFFAADLVDQIVLYVAPKVFSEGKSWVGTFGLSDIGSKPTFELVDTQLFEGDVKLTYHSRNLAEFLASYLV
jgi:diaminohydroxyphosphoribosylaminopyrimidine deaminase/5-amino-6-(5-phosphoribosylamino)uracil reductase